MIKKDYDELRQKRLEALGVKLIRFEDKVVKRNMNEVLRALETAIVEIEKNIPLTPFKGGIDNASFICILEGILVNCEDNMNCKFSILSM